MFWIMDTDKCKLLKCTSANVTSLIITINKEFLRFPWQGSSSFFLVSVGAAVYAPNSGKLPYLLLGTKDGTLDRLNEDEVEAGAAVEAAGVSKLKAAKPAKPPIPAGCCY